MKRHLAILAIWAVVYAAQGCSPLEDQPSAELYTPAACGSPDHALTLADHLTEADLTFLDRLAALDTSSLPEFYNTEELFDLDRSLIAYMLDVAEFQELKRDDLMERGELGRSILLALGTNPNPRMVDYKELRRGLYHFYNCSRNHPATLEDFIRVYGDYRTWSSTIVEDSDPKIYPRRLYGDPQLGVYVAETLRDNQIHETEILLEGYRNDGALEFLGYLPSGELTNRGEFRAGADFAAAAAPYTCMGCHIDTDTGAYTVIFPDMGHQHSRK